MVKAQANAWKIGDTTTQAKPKNGTSKVNATVKHPKVNYWSD